MNSLFLLLGQFISQVGDQIYNVGLLWWLLKNNYSPKILGTIFAISVIPSVLLGPFLGVLSDRLDRKK